MNHRSFISVFVPLVVTFRNCYYKKGFGLYVDQDNLLKVVGASLITSLKLKDF